MAFAGHVLAVVQATGSATRALLGWLADKMATPLEIAAGRIMLVQTIGSAVLFLVPPIVESTTAIVVIFGMLGITAFGFTGIYYSFLIALVSEDDVGAASAGGQLAVNIGGFGSP